MHADQDEREEGHATGSLFATTDWSVVLAAGNASAPGAEEALEKLCRTYWYPLYAYVRSRGYRSQDAQDLTQEFFSRFVAKEYLEHVDQAKGRFRSFLLACMKHFLANEWDKVRTLKRGGRVHFLSWDEGVTEAQVDQDLTLSLNPERLFARRWALTVLDVVEARLRAYYADAGKQRLYDQLDAYINGDPEHTVYADAARALGMNAAAVETAMRRMRRRYALWLREEIARTVRDAAEVDDELRLLRQALAG